MSDLYAHKKYKFNPKIREIIEAQMGEKMDEISNVDVENIFRDVCLKGEFNKEKTYSDKEKDKLLFVLNEIDPNQYKDSYLLNLSIFIKHTFTKDEIIDYVKRIINRRYKPGMVLYNVRVVNEQTVLFLSLFHEYFKTYRGVIINTTFIGDMKRIFPEIKYDEDTGELKDDTQTLMSNLVTKAKKTFGKKIKIATKDEVYVFASDDEDVIKNFEEDFFNSLKIDVIPKYYFNWE